MEELKIHQFNCLDCGLKFTIESEEENIIQLAKQIKIRCPKCEKIWGEKDSKIEHSFNVPSVSIRTHKGLKALGKENEERTRLAHQAAYHYKQEHAEELETVAVKRPPNVSQKGPIISGGAVEQLPKRVVSAIEKRVSEGE